MEGLAHRAAQRPSELTAEAAFALVMTTCARGLREDAARFRAAVDRVILNVSDALGTEPQCIDQGPAHAPILFLPDRLHAADMGTLVGALADAVSTPLHHALGTPRQSCRAALSCAFSKGQSNQAASAPAGLISQIIGELRDTDAAGPVHAFQIEKRTACALEGPQAWAGRLRWLGDQALRDLAKAALSITPTDWLAQRTPPDAHVEPAPFDRRAAIGAAIEALAASPYHRQFHLDHYLKIEILPALRAGQARFYVHPDGRPWAMVTWARMSDAALQDVLNTGRCLRHAEWQSGPHLFFNDWITNGARVVPIVADLKRFFPDTIATSLRRRQDRSVRKSNAWQQQPPDPDFKKT